MNTMVRNYLAMVSAIVLLCGVCVWTVGDKLRPDSQVNAEVKLPEWRVSNNPSFRFTVHGVTDRWSAKVAKGALAQGGYVVKGRLEFEKAQDTSNAVSMKAIDTEMGLDVGTSATKAMEKDKFEGFFGRLDCEAVLHPEGRVEITDAKGGNSVLQRLLLMAVHCGRNTEEDCGSLSTPREYDEFSYGWQRCVSLAEMLVPHHGRKKDIVAVAGARVTNGGSYHKLQYVTSEGGKVLYGRAQTTSRRTGDPRSEMVKVLRVEVYAIDAR